MTGLAVGDGLCILNFDYLIIEGNIRANLKKTLICNKTCLSHILFHVEVVLLVQ